MKELQQFWRELNHREQWLALGVAAVAVVMIYLMALHDPAVAENKRLQQQVASAKDRRVKAMTEMGELQAKLDADPNRAYQAQLLSTVAESERLNKELNQLTLALVPPDKMRLVLEQLLKKQGGLALVNLESFSEAVQAEKPKEAKNTIRLRPDDAPATSLLYRHGVRLTLEGSYFDLLNYLRAVEQSGWKIFWDRLDYVVTTPPKARIDIIVFTLSRDAEWIGV